MQLDTLTRTALAVALETHWGNAITIEIRTLAKPTNTTDADVGSVLSTITPAADWATQANGTLTFANLPLIDAAADASGTPGHYRIKAGAVVKSQGTVSLTGGGGDMELDSMSVTAGQEVRITNWSIAIGGAV